MQNDILRRAVIGALTAGAMTWPFCLQAAATPIGAIAFDGFLIFDPRPIAVRARALFPEKGDMLANIWAAKLFGYTWLETAAGRYDDFETLANAALIFAADSIGLDLPASVRAELVGHYGRMDVRPDVKPALERLKHAEIRLVFLSNLSEAFLRSNMRNAGIAEYFEPPMSTDRVRQYKPAPAAYQMAIDAFRLPKDAIGFAAFGGWDAASATWFGYRTAWTNRLGLPGGQLDPKPAIVSGDISGVLTLAGIPANAGR